MKDLKEYLNEGLISRKISISTPIRYRPNSREELIANIIELLNKGITNLNCIDVSEIDDMYDVFHKVNLKAPVKDIDISEWNVTKVKDMSFMFDFCTEFNADLSKWDVSNVEDTSYMFDHCYEFNSDITKWKFNNLKHTEDMFSKCYSFDYDLSEWDDSKIRVVNGMFGECTTLKKNNKIPSWYTGRV